LDTYRITLFGGNGAAFNFHVFNGTAGFNPAMVIRGGGKTFVVNHGGPSRDENFNLRVFGTVRVKVTIGAFHSATVGNYCLTVNP
jgi:hypothetical protein